MKVRFCVGPEGTPEKVELVESSGVALLDDAAIGCVLARAAPLPRVRDCAALPVRFAIGH